MCFSCGVRFCAAAFCCFPKGPLRKVSSASPPHAVTVRALTFCAHSSHFGTHNGYPLCYEMPRSSSLAREDKMSNHKKRTQPQQSCDCVFFEIRQRVILPGAMCQVLSPRTSLTSVFGMGTGGSSSPLSPEWLRLLDLNQRHCG